MNTVCSLVMTLGCALLLAGCHFDFAVTNDPGRPLVPGLTGRWVQSDELKPDEFQQVLVVFPTDDGGGVIDYQVKEDEHWLFRVCSLGKDHPGLHQLEFLGSSTGQRPEAKRFTVVRAEVKGDALEWRLIDPGKVGEVENASQLLGRLADREVFGDVHTFRSAAPVKEE